MCMHVNLSVFTQMPSLSWPSSGTHFTDSHITLQPSSPALFWPLLLPVSLAPVWLLSLFLDNTAGHARGKKPQHKAAREACEIWKGSSASGATEKARQMPHVVPCVKIGMEVKARVHHPGCEAGSPALSYICHGLSLLGSSFSLSQMGSATYWVTFWK